MPLWLHFDPPGSLRSAFRADPREATILAPCAGFSSASRRGASSMGWQGQRPFTAQLKHRSTFKRQHMLVQPTHNMWARPFRFRARILSEPKN